MSVDLRLGDCLEVMRVMPDASVDSIVTDPPYGLSFMGKKWDYDVPGVDVWAECLRVLKPGGHLLAFAGTRTQHRMAVRIEDAGFEIRDMIAWVYGSGFPKSLDVSKAIDKAAGAEREITGAMNKCGMATAAENYQGNEKWSGIKRDNPATEAARQWQGWGTALKPALEPITVARKPLVGTVVANVLAHGTGALNIDGCRVGTEGGTRGSNYAKTGLFGVGGKADIQQIDAGRWPANLIHDGSDEVVGLFPVTTSGGGNKSRKGTTEGGNCYGTHGAPPPDVRGADKGSAARFFYCAKASKKDRDEGCEGLPQRVIGTWGGDDDDLSPGKKSTVPRGNTHPTVKPTDLMAYLCRLVTPPGGVVLDPFMGSGSTGKAAVGEGFRFVGCEMSPEYMAIAKVRIQRAIEQFLGGLA